MSSYLGQENLILTVPNPEALGPLADTIIIDNVTATNITVTNLAILGPISLGGFVLSTTTNGAGTTTSATVATGLINSNAALIPEGNGAIVADLPDAAVSGGNARGTNAVDLQMSRAAATQVASGANSGILCGASNTASGTVSAVLCGDQNNVGAANSSILSGQTGTIANTVFASSIVTGTGNTISGVAGSSTIVCGASNTLSGVINSSILGGNTNSCTTGSNSVIVNGNGNSNTNTVSCCVIGSGSANANATATTLIGSTLVNNNSNFSCAIGNSLNLTNCGGCNIIGTNSAIVGVTNSIAIGNSITNLTNSSIIINSGTLAAISHGNELVQIEGRTLELNPRRVGGDLASGRVVTRNAADEIIRIEQTSQVVTIADAVFETLISTRVENSTSYNATVMGVLVRASGLTSTMCFRSFVKCDGAGTVTTSGFQPITGYTPATWTGPFGGVTDEIPAAQLGLLIISGGANTLLVQISANPGSGVDAVKVTGTITMEAISWNF